MIMHLTQPSTTASTLCGNVDASILEYPHPNPLPSGERESPAALYQVHNPRLLALFSAGGPALGRGCFGGGSGPVQPVVKGLVQ